MSAMDQHADLRPLVERRPRAASPRARAGACSRSRSGSRRSRSVFLLPSKHLILTEIAILALFALSLDLILGYAGIVSLGHAAFFGFGAYVAGILAKHGIINEPVLALLASGLAAAVLGFVTSFLVLRGSDLTRLMVTLGVALVLREIANQLEITGGADGLQGVVMEPILGHFAFDIFGQTAYVYSLVVLFVLFLIARRIVNSPFGLSLRSVQGQSAARLGDRHSRQRPAGRGLHHRGRLRGHRGRAADADDAVRLALGARLRALRRRAADADHRRHRLSLRRPDRRGAVQAGAGLSRQRDAAVLAVLARPRAGDDDPVRARLRRRDGGGHLRDLHRS